MLSYNKRKHESVNKTDQIHCRQEQKEIATDSECSNVLRGLAVRSGETVVLTHLSTRDEEAVST